MNNCSRIVFRNSVFFLAIPRQPHKHTRESSCKTTDGKTINFASRLPGGTSARIGDADWFNEGIIARRLRVRLANERRRRGARKLSLSHPRIHRGRSWWSRASKSRPRHRNEDPRGKDLRSNSLASTSLTGLSSCSRNGHAFFHWARGLVLRRMCTLPSDILIFLASRNIYDQFAIGELFTSESLLKIISCREKSGEVMIRCVRLVSYVRLNFIRWICENRSNDRNPTTVFLEKKKCHVVFMVAQVEYVRDGDAYLSSQQLYGTCGHGDFYRVHSSRIPNCYLYFRD